MARPTKFTWKVFNTICTRMAAGETLREICREKPMPAESTVRVWAALDKPNGVYAAYARAREALAQRWADETVEIADDGSNDWMERRRRDGSIEVVVDREHVERSKLRVAQRNWLLQRLVRREFGDRAEKDSPDDKAVTITGGLPE